MKRQASVGMEMIQDPAGGISPPSLGPLAPTPSPHNKETYSIRPNNIDPKDPKGGVPAANLLLQHLYYSRLKAMPYLSLLIQQQQQHQQQTGQQHGEYTNYLAQLAARAAASSEANPKLLLSATSTRIDNPNSSNINTSDKKDDISSEIISKDEEIIIDSNDDNCDTEQSYNNDHNCKIIVSKEILS